MKICPRNEKNDYSSIAGNIICVVCIPLFMQVASFREKKEKSLEGGDRMYSCVNVQEYRYYSAVIFLDYNQLQS